MKNHEYTTVGNVCERFEFIEDNALQYMDEALSILNIQLPEEENDQWADIMFNKDGKLFAVWGTSLGAGSGAEDAECAEIEENDLMYDGLSYYDAVQQKADKILRDRKLEKERERKEREDRFELEWRKENEMLIL